MFILYEYLYTNYLIWKQGLSSVNWDLTSLTLTGNWVYIVWECNVYANKVAFVPRPIPDFIS